MRSVILALLCLVSLTPALSSQDVPGNLSGIALTADGHPLAGVSVTVAGPTLQGTVTTSTDARGFFRAMALPVGTYTVQIRHVAYRPVDVEGAVVNLGRTKALGEFRLQAEPLELEPIVVRAEPAIIDSTPLRLRVDLGHVLQLDVRHASKPIGANLVSLSEQARRPARLRRQDALDLGPEPPLHLRPPRPRAEAVGRTG